MGKVFVIRYYIRVLDIIAYIKYNLYIIDYPSTMGSLYHRGMFPLPYYIICIL